MSDKEKAEFLDSPFVHTILGFALTLGQGSYASSAFERVSHRLRAARGTSGSLPVWEKSQEHSSSPAKEVMLLNVGTKSYIGQGRATQKW